MMKRSNRKNPFTLIELLVSMGLLSLLVMLMLQLFGGAQRLWIASDKRGNLYADARVALELMSELVGSTRFSHGENTDGTRLKSKDMVFHLDTSNKLNEAQGDLTDANILIFVAKSNRDLPHKDSNTFFISFQRGSGDNRGKLYMTVFSDKKDEDTFYKLFPPYGLDGGPADRDASLTALKTLLTPQETESEYSQVIAENVIGLAFNVYALDSNGKLEKKIKSLDCDEPPYMLEIQLSVLSKDDYEKYGDISDETSRKNFLDQHRHTFTRSVFIGNRWALEAK